MSKIICFVKVILIAAILCLLPAACSFNEGNIVQTMKAEEEAEKAAAPPADTAAASTGQLKTEAESAGNKSQVVIKSWEEYEASPQPLIAAIPEKNIFLYDTKADRVLLKVGEMEQYFPWICLTPRFILPRMNLFDYDEDGKDELSVILYVGSGTGVSVEELHILEIAESGQTQETKDEENTVYFKDLVFGDYAEQLKKSVAFKVYEKAGEQRGEITLGSKTYDVSLKDYQSDDYGKIQNELLFGNIVRFSSDSDRLAVELAAGLHCEKAFEPQYIGVINADVIYGQEKFELKNPRFVKDGN